jgi:hypothetical protein
MTSLPSVTRRRALTLGGASLAGLAVPRGASARVPAAHAALHHRRGSLPVGVIQDIVGAEGSVSAGVLDITIDRKDVGPVKGPMGVTFPPSFEVNGDLTFQPLGGDLAFFNGDLALKASELNPVVDAIYSNGLVFQAMHQHYFDLDPMVWFVHFRGIGKPRTLAHAVRKVLNATATPLPQKRPIDPKTPLDHGKLAKTLHGSGDVGDDGVVTVSVSRSDRIVIGDVQVSPEANISTNIQFLPLDAVGTKVAVAPDFSMLGSEVGPVCRRMRAAGFEIGCLYNQETDEHPQLYFAHMIAVGNPQKLAVEIRTALDHTNAD